MAAVSCKKDAGNVAFERYSKTSKSQWGAQSQGVAMTSEVFTATSLKEEL